MTSKPMEAPEYNDRVHEILRGLRQGKTREELAAEASNKNWKSVDVYMRRRGFSWDANRQTYIPKIEPVEHEFAVDATKAGDAIRMIEKEGSDVRTVAERLRFKNHRELASYMDVKGYIWDEEISNYRKRLGQEQVAQKASKLEPNAPLVAVESRNELPMPFVPSAEHPVELNQYLPLLQLLETHQEKLTDLLIPTGQVGVIPRYVVPGHSKTKTVYMMSSLEQLVVDFSREKNMSQRELFEVALIEFFTKYGYDYEISRLLTDK